MGFDPARAFRFAGLGALILFLCWQHVQATRLGYQVETSRRQARELRGRVEDMRLKLDESLAPAALAARASAKLGMVPGDPDRLRLLPPRAPEGLRVKLWARGFAPFAFRS